MQQKMHYHDEICGAIDKRMVYYDMPSKFNSNPLEAPNRKDNQKQRKY